MLGHSWHCICKLWPNGLRCHLCQCHALLRWHHLCVSCHPAGQQLHTNRQYNHQASLPGGESLLTPRSTKLPPLVIKVPRTAGDRGLEVGKVVVNLPVTPGECKRGPPSRRQGGRRLIRRVISPPGNPPTTAPESTLPQRGGQARTLPRDPMWMAAKYWSVGWKKDLEHALKIYYRYNIASFKEAEWVRVRDKFFTHLLLHKEEALGIKERCPMDYMLYIEEQFWNATGLRLNGLQDFTVWIKPGSYYHGLVAQQGHLHKCLHLAGVPLPRWPQVTPSKSCLVSQKKPETLTTSSSEPSARATETPVTHSDDTPAPMETGRVGDSQSWAERVEADVDEDFQKDRPTKCRRSQSKRREERPMLPFPLQDSKGRHASILQLYEHVGEQPVARHNVAAQGIIHLHPEMMPREARRLGNQVLCMIAEYHLTRSAQGPLSLSPVLPEATTTLLPPVEDYVLGERFQGTRDVRVVDRARTL